MGLTLQLCAVKTKLNKAQQYSFALPKLCSNVVTPRCQNYAHKGPILQLCTANTMLRKAQHCNSALPTLYPKGSNTSTLPKLYPDGPNFAAPYCVQMGLTLQYYATIIKPKKV